MPGLLIFIAGFCSACAMYIFAIDRAVLRAMKTNYLANLAMPVYLLFTPLFGLLGGVAADTIYLLWLLVFRRTLNTGLGLGLLALLVVIVVGWHGLRRMLDMR